MFVVPEALLEVRAEFAEDDGVGSLLVDFRAEGEPGAFAEDC